MNFDIPRAASKVLAATDTARVDETLLSLADALEKRADELLAANAADCAEMDSADPRYDRLLLTRGRIEGIADGIRDVAALPSPLGIVLDETVRPNGMVIRKVSVPFGVIGSIFEARPNVIFDIFALCFKSGSACVLKGGHEAKNSSEASAAIIHDVLRAHGLPEGLAAVLPSTREATAELLGARGKIDLIIPRGSRRLIDFVRENATVPVIETGAGVCHTYFNESGDTAIGSDIIFNAKTRRVGVCNALDCVIIDRSRLADLPELCRRLAEKNVEIHADDEAYAALEASYLLLKHASDEDFGHEWLDYKLSVKTVADIDEALAFIDRYGSQHSECIIADDKKMCRRFLNTVDAACVYANVSTAFTDGAQFGLGAEIGISTQKLHARGPMGLKEITSYKYIITGAGQTRQ